MKRERRRHDDPLPEQDISCARTTQRTQQIVESEEDAFLDYDVKTTHTHTQKCVSLRNAQPQKKYLTSSLDTAKQTHGKQDITVEAELL